ncbi:MAG: hypothetical protein OEV78_08805 [Spirochaetia bacterium]|nr:hypothetical protein [Spirochaetia bacterium]
MNEIERLLKELQNIENKIIKEIQKSKSKYLYTILRKKIKFESATKKYHKTLAKGIFRYLASVNPLYILTAPVIYSLIIPALILDLSVYFYQLFCFPIYKIPKVKRGDYILFDHQFLSYLNIFEKFHCRYCSYFNGLISYVQEVAARTEQHFCPIKHARNMVTVHSRYKKFIDYGAANEFKSNLLKVSSDFTDIKNK